ncbi:hypothetical protein V6N13_136563 [Hibiscus sabdariffa]
MSSIQLTRGASDKSLSPTKQQAKIDDVRKLIGPVADKLPVLCSEASILRFLRARNWNTKKASKMLKETMKWRLQHKPEAIRWVRILFHCLCLRVEVRVVSEVDLLITEDIAQEAETGKIYRANFGDKLGRPVLVMRPGLQNTNSQTGQIKYLVYCIENAIMNMVQDQEQMVWLVDFQGWKMGSISVKVTRETANILQDHYPERLGMGILYNPPKIFESFWTIVKPFLEPRTYQKMKFLYSNDPNSMKVVEEIFDLDSLDVAFGGRNAAGFNYEAYAQQMKEDDIKRLNSLSSGCLSESSQQQSTDLDHGSNASDDVRLSPIDAPTAPNSKCIDEKTTKGVSLNCKDIQVAEAAVAKQFQFLKLQRPWFSGIFFQLFGLSSFVCSLFHLILALRLEIEKEIFLSRGRWGLKEWSLELKSFPLLFSFLVTASPVLVCTAVLLGTLLSFGSPNIPEIEKQEEENVSHEVSPLKTRAAEDDTVVKRDFTDDDFVVQRHVGKGWDIVENADEKVTLVDNEVNGVEEGDGSVLYTPLVNDDLDSRDIHCENGVIDEVEGLLSHSLLEKTTEIREEMLDSERVSSMMREAEESQHLLADVGDRNLEVVDGKLTSDIDDGPRDNELDSSLVFSWQCAASGEDAGDGGKDDDEDDDDDDDDESSDSGSDGAESSSPDASLADISLMLDELHPLLGLEATQPAHLSRDGSDTASESSHGSSNDESVESDELDNEGEGGNEEEGDGAKGDKEDESKSAIKWTEDDQKILMDLGTLEVERNLRLDKLIARRRARKSARLMAEMNLIDFDSADIPLNLAPISTSRGNPFDLPYDSYGDLGLPPIPGSAPSNLQPRRNPFDLPYDSSEEKPDLKGDSFHEELSGFNQRGTVSQRDTFFCRHESFNVGSSSLGVPRQELKWKPYFVLEQLVSEGASPSLFQRQSSEVSESKLSSVPDSESVSSVVDEEDNEPNKQDVSRETELIFNEDRVSAGDEQESHASDEVESVDVDQVENRDVHHDVVEITLGDGESQMEIESMSEAGAASYSEHNDSEAKNSDGHRDAVVITLGDGGPAISHVEFNATEIHPRTEPAEEEDSSRSSLSSLSEIDEKILDLRGGEFAGFEPRDHEVNESGISKRPSFEESEFHFTSEVVGDNQHTEPIFYSSFHPPSVETFLSFSSVSSNIGAEISEMGSPSMLVESTGRKCEAHCEMAELDTSSFQEIHACSSDLLNVNEQKARDLLEISEHDVTFNNSTGISSTSADHNVSTIHESVVEYVSREAGSSSDESLEEDVPNKEESSIQNQLDLLSFGAEITLAVDKGMDDVMDSSPEEQEHQMHPDESVEAETVNRHIVEMEDTPFEQDELIQTECDQMHLSNFDLNLDGHHDKGEELSAMALTYQHRPSNDVISSTAEEPGYVVVDQVQEVNPSGASLREEHEKESEMDQIHSPFSDSKTGTVLDSEMNVEGIPSISCYQDMSSSENPSSESKEQLLFDKDELPIDEHDKQLEEPSMIATESRREANDVNNDIIVYEVHESEDKLSMNSSSTTSESTYFPSESPKHTLPTDQEDLREMILKEIESEGPDEHFSYVEVYAPHVDEENNSEVNEIKEIDEAILSELDTVGDFNVGEMDLPEGSHVTYTESAMVPEDIGMKNKANVELPVLEARSVEDIDLAFKQFHEGVDVEEVILPSMIENQLDHADTMSDLPVVEARSLEDIHNALQQGPVPNSAQLLHSTEWRNGSSEVEQHDVVSYKEVEVSNAVSDIQESCDNTASEPENNEEVELKTETNVELPVLEARSAEDIDLAFKQLHEGVDVEEVILPSMIGNRLDHVDTSSELSVVEARSLDDIHNAFQKGPEPNTAELPHSTDLRNRSTEVEQHDVVSTKGIEVGKEAFGFQEDRENADAEPKNEYKEIEMETKVELPVVEARSVEDIDLAFRQLNEGVDIEKLILPSIIENQQGHADTNLDLPVVDARSLEDIHATFQQGSGSNQVELPHSSGAVHDVVSIKEIDGSNAVSVVQGTSENAGGEPKNEYEDREEREMETKVALPVLEAKSVEDIDLAFKQLHEGVDVEEVILPSKIENLQVLSDPGSILPVIEARSLEDIHSLFQQGPESNPSELPHSSKKHDGVSVEEIEVSENAVSWVQEHTENAAGDPTQEHEKSSEKSNLKLKGKKIKSHDSSSSSSSSDSE